MTSEAKIDQGLVALQTEGRNLAHEIEAHHKHGMVRALEVAALSFQFGQRHEVWEEMVSDDLVADISEEIKSASGVDVGGYLISIGGGRDEADNLVTIKRNLMGKLNDELTSSLGDQTVSPAGYWQGNWRFSQEKLKRIATIAGMMGAATNNRPSRIDFGE